MADDSKLVPVAERPRGKAARWPGGKLDALSQITEADIERAKESWKQLVSPRYRTLLDATPAAKR